MKEKKDLYKTLKDNAFPTNYRRRKNGVDKDGKRLNELHEKDKGSKEKKLQKGKVQNQLYSEIVPRSRYRKNHRKKKNKPSFETNLHARKNIKDHENDVEAAEVHDATNQDINPIVNDNNQCNDDEEKGE